MFRVQKDELWLSLELVDRVFCVYVLAWGQVAKLFEIRHGCVIISFCQWNWKGDGLFHFQLQVLKPSALVLLW